MKWLLLSLILFSAIGQAKQRDFHAVAAFSTNFSFPGSIRLGWRDWEIGRLTPFSYGFDKIFDLNEHAYTSFGFALSSSLGLYAGVGFSYSWYRIGVRGELTTVFDFSGFSQGLGILGVSYGF